MEIANQILSFAKERNSTASFNYNKGYIKTSVEGLSNRFMTLKPQKRVLKLSILCPKSIEMDRMIEEAGYEIEYDEDSGKYVFWIYPEDFSGDKQALRKLIHCAYDASFAPTTELQLS